MIIFIVAIITAFFVIPNAFLFGVIFSILSKNRNKRYFVHIAVSIDQLGNVVCAPLFNCTLIKKTGYKFGNVDETISSVLGKNELTNTLTFIGKGLCAFLNILEKNHVQKAIEENP